MRIDEYYEAMARVPQGPLGPRGGLEIYRITVPPGPAPGRRAPAGRGPMREAKAQHAAHLRA
jgi:hypothetical protein